MKARKEGANEEVKDRRQRRRREKKEKKGKRDRGKKSETRVRNKPLALVPEAKKSIIEKTALFFPFVYLEPFSAFKGLFVTCTLVRVFNFLRLFINDWI